MRLLALLTAAVLLTVGTPAWAEQAREDCSSLCAAARKGDDTAVMALAVLAKREGASDQEMSWYRLGAERGNASAADSLGQVYERQGNFEQAAKWYRQALEAKGLGNGQAALQLADLILSGRIPAPHSPRGNYLPVLSGEGWPTCCRQTFGHHVSDWLGRAPRRRGRATMAEPCGTSRGAR